MADTVDSAASSSPPADVEEPQDGSPADAAEQQPRDAESPRPEGEAEEREEAAAEPERDRSVTELLEQLARELGDLGVSEAQLEAARNLPAVRRAARDIVGALVVVVAVLTAFAFVNVAAADGLSRVMATWLAALVLAAGWIAIGGVLFLFFRRARRWLLWLVVKAPPAEAMQELKDERDDAARAARITLERLGPAVAIQIALAAVPKAGEVAGEVAGGVIEVGDSVLEASDEVVEVIAEELPGGGVASQVWSVALMPGRFGIRVATIVLRRGRRVDGAVSDAGPER